MITHVHIENLKEIQQELTAYSDNLKPTNLENANVFVVNQALILDKFPVLQSWLLEKFKVYPVTFKFYITPPYKEMDPHIDGTNLLPLNFGFNIPVKNCSHSETIFYDCPEDNIKQESSGHVSTRLPKDKTKLQIKEKFVIDSPCWINTSVMHSVKNYSSESRVMFLIRWHSKLKDWSEVI